MEVSSIQQLIDEKAKERLLTDIKKIHDVLQNGLGYKLLSDIYVEIGTVEKPRKKQLSYVLRVDSLGKDVFEKHIERYIKEETDSFVKKVESLRDDVDFLLDNVK